ncbi:hypothetical protein CsatB_009733 [Cannabis sativa]
MVVTSVLQGEMETLRFGALLALDLHAEGVEFFFDNLQLVQSLVACQALKWDFFFIVLIILLKL